LNFPAAENRAVSGGYVKICFSSPGSYEHVRCLLVAIRIQIGGVQDYGTELRADDTSRNRKKDEYGEQ